ncbi:hypothetical protein C0030_004460 [Candidatus Liberibacter solanacearum]|uniref:Uncharacterized protein n=1 Tax=Candidatus Liberibacter solanacearum TaxID=556287 RepID=A0A424FLQ7_9HYPH|nr:hypothetical protein [Candidatus Liberibacter solanacearum]RPD37083.1 hypothetical protein C0030_004460 [Candidatus Liberibacter solanacearum]
MIESFLAGGLLSFLSEGVVGYMKYLKAKEDHRHEAELQKFSLKADRQRMELAKIEGNIKIESDTINADTLALIEATKAQSVKSGIGWIDGLSSLIRPLITIQWVILFYPLVKIAMMAAEIKQNGVSVALFDIVLGDFEQHLVASIVGYWFCDRAMRIKKRRRG